MVQLSGARLILISRKRSVAFIIAGVAACLTLILGCRALQPKPAFRVDLRAYGYPTETLGRIVGNYTDIAFLSNNLLLVAVNTKTYGTEEPDADEFPPDEPDARLLVFDLSRRGLVKEGEFPATKASDSIQALGENRFVLLSHAGLHICASDLECGTLVKTHGPIFVSPGGNVIAAGGRGHSDQILVNAATLQEVQHFPANAPKVLPGDRDLLVLAGGKFYTGSAQNPETHFLRDAVGGAVWPEAAFLNDDTVAVFSDDEQMTVMRTDGHALFRQPLLKGTRLKAVCAAVSGTRFCLQQAGQSRMRSLLNGVREKKDYDFEQVNVLGASDGKSYFKLDWNPQPYVGNLSRPALSPDGHHLALVRGGALEIFDVP